MMMMTTPNSEGLHSAPVMYGESIRRTPNVQRCKNAAASLLRVPSSQRYGRQFNDLPYDTIIPAVSTLPTEILCEIFLACARATLDNPSWTWMNLANVCSSWRRAMLGCHDLWTHIDFTHPSRTAYTLKRAYNAPLIIRTVVQNHHIEQLYNILRGFYQIREIDLVFSVHHFKVLFEALARPSHSLQSLTVRVIQPNDKNAISYRDCPVLPTEGAPLPSLKHLELHQAPFTFVSPRFSALTSLSLYDLPPSEQPSLRDFLSLVVKFPLLQHLTLVRAFPRPITSGGASDIGRRIRLPRLVTLSLRGYSREMSQVINYLILPPSVRISCTVEGLQDSTLEFRKLAKALGVHFAISAQAQQFQRLVITGREQSYRFLSNNQPNPAFRQSLRVRGFGAEAGWENAMLDLSIMPDQSSSHDTILVAWLSAMWRSLPLQRVHTLALQNIDVITQSSWTKLLRSLDGVNVLEINGHAPSGLVWALLLNARAQLSFDVEEDDTDNLLLPNLHDVFLYDVDCFGGGFMVSSAAVENSHRDLDDSRFLDVLLVYLEERKKHSMALRSLQVFQCGHVLPQVLQDLKKCVQSVYWDRRGSFTEGEEISLQSPAQYRRTWLHERPDCRHYFRLLTLLQGQR